MSHLAVVGLEEGFLIVRDKDAFAKYKEGCRVMVTVYNGSVKIME